MALVALCPRCSHDLLVPNDTDPDLWAQCSTCNVLFQVKDAIMRDVPELQLVAPVPEPAGTEDAYPPGSPRDELLSPHPTPTIAISSQKTIGDAGPIGGAGESSLLDVTAGDDDVPFKLPAHSAPTVEDIQPLSSPAREGATIELGSDGLQSADTDFELEIVGEPPSIDSLATWDDSEHMERLLSGDETAPPDDAPMPLPQPDSVASEEAPSSYQPFINTDMFAMPPGPRRRRQPSMVRTLVGIVLAGIIGTGLGSVVLLWLMGPSGDILGIAHHLPRAILPASFSTVPIPLADETTRVDRDTKPAGFDAPATTGKSASESMMDDVAAIHTQEPAAFESSGAAPLAEGNSIAVSGSPTFAPDELAVALQVAQEAQPGLIRGDLRDGKEVQHAKGYSYSMLCDLANKLTFVDSTSRPDYVQALQQKADDLFRTTLSDSHVRNEIALIIPRWLSYDKRQHGGVFLAGTIEGEVGKGSVVECQVGLGTGEPVTILVPKTRSEGLDHAGRPVGIIGSIVDSPAQHVTGYEGDAKQAVWVGRIVPLD